MSTLLLPSAFFSSFELFVERWQLAIGRFACLRNFNSYVLALELEHVQPAPSIATTAAAVAAEHD